MIVTVSKKPLQRMVVTNVCYFSCYLLTFSDIVDGTIKNGGKTRCHVQLYMRSANSEVLAAGQLRRPFSQI